MASEVIIEEYASFDANIQCPTAWITTQVLDIGEVAAALSASTKYVVITSRGTGFWYSFNGAAAADTAGNSWLPADTSRPHRVQGLTIDTAAAS